MAPNGQLVIQDADFSPVALQDASHAEAAGLATMRSTGVHLALGPELEAMLTAAGAQVVQVDSESSPGRGGDAAALITAMTLEHFRDRAVNPGAHDEAIAAAVVALRRPERTFTGPTQWIARCRAPDLNTWSPDALLVALELRLPDGGQVHIVAAVGASLGREDPAYDGQAVYTARFLRLYDLLVLRFNGHLAWRCGPTRLVRMYNENASARHLDIGVGTGYFLDKCRFPTGSPDITLMDLNPNSLNAAARRIRRYHPRTYQGNALEPFALPEGSFDSIGLNWLLHCMPGDMAGKSVVFDHCRTVLAPGGIVFGSTVLSGGVPQTRFSRWMLDQLNDGNKTFHNRQDDLDGLRAELNRRFQDVHVEVVGSVAVFSGHR